MDLYLENGYCNIPAIIRRGMPFTFIIGGRGTGKTYGALQYVIANHVRFALMRRTQAQLDTIARPETNPFKTVIRDMDVDWVCEPESIGKSIYGYFRKKVNEDGSATAEELLGYGVALSTVANLRGFDLSDTDLIIYDEFIPETHERKMAAESDAFFNAYETINRNRELQGKKPTQVIALANANDFACPLLIGLNLVSTIERMIKTGKTEYVSPQKGVAIILLTDSPVSSAKASTALYKLTSGTAFAEMAINNAFDGSNDPDVYSVNLQEYNPVVSVGELCAYRHKSAPLYYISTHVSGSVGHYSGDGVDMRRFMATHKNLLMAAITGRVIYESHLVKALFLRYCGLG